MLELIQAAAQAVTIPYTILLAVVLLYWGAVLIGIFDLGSSDFELDLDPDVDAAVDVDTEVDTEVDGQGGSAGGGIAGLLTFFNFGRVPFMIIMTFLVLAMWTISILVHYFAGNHTWILAAALFFPNLFVSLIFAKIVTSPLVRVFRHFDGTVEAVDYLGRECTLLLSIAPGQVGQAEVIVDDANLLISVKLREDLSQGMQRGDKGVVTGRSADAKFYWVKPLPDLP